MNHIYVVHIHIYVVLKTPAEFQGGNTLNPKRCCEHVLP